jgi:hypothetical protein
MNGNPINHMEILNPWLYGIKQGTIPETRYSVLPNDVEITQFNFQQHQACISRGGFQQIAGVTWATNNQAANVDNHASVLQQLITTISAQNKEAIESNYLCRNEILCQVSQEESKKDCTQKIHPSIIKLICRAATLCFTDETEALPATCSCFINQENVGMAQYNLVHQFKGQGFHDITFALGTTNALYVGGFLYADSSTPSNFTIFAFHEQELNLDNRQHNYLICHLIQVEGQKKSLDEIKASLKQLVQVPSNFNGLGTQIQLFGAALTIVFGEDSVCTSNLNQLLTMIGRNKKSFQDQIALDDFFSRKIPFCYRQTSSTLAEVVRVRTQLPHSSQ